MDEASLPAAEVGAAVAQIMADPATARAALQYGSTQGLPALREKVLAHTCLADGVSPADVNLTADDVVITTGSQQLLYMLGELLLNPGDIVITEAPSYFVYHGILGSLGIRTLTVPMDEQGMNTDALEELRMPADRTVGVGDAENDHAFLRHCGVAVAVANALPSVKAAADLGRPLHSRYANEMSWSLSGTERMR